MRLLILGGYGVFGGRLAELLADLAGLEMLIAGRDLARATAFCARYKGPARVTPLALDRRDIAAALGEHAPTLVVDASGPFQEYGTDRYRVIEACIAAGVDYLDFADAADFVFGVPAFDAAAKAAGVFALSGVSSFPVLTAAVLREVARDVEIATVEGGIAPSPFAGIGLNVMRAVLGYAGGPVTLRRGGGEAVAAGLTESRRFTVAVPGALPLRNLRFSLVDVPDLRVLPPEHPGMAEIWMGAGPVPEVLHRMLNLLARARARGWLPSLVPFSKLFYLVLNLLRFGEHRGGMYVRVTGTSAGRPVERSWHLIAEGADGPYIPSMAIEAIVRKLARGERPPSGARSGAGALSLADYDALFEGRAIRTGFRDDEPEAALYSRALGSAFARLPERVGQLHAGKGRRQWAGTAEVRRGHGLLARLVARAFGFPEGGPAVPVTVTFEPDGAGERWTRDFGGRRLTSVQSLGTGPSSYLIEERFGAVTVGIALVIDGDTLRFVPRRWAILGLTMPGFLLPRGNSFETEANGAFAFHVEVVVPLIGLVVSYAGTLTPVSAT